MINTHTERQTLTYRRKLDQAEIAAMGEQLAAEENTRATIEAEHKLAMADTRERISACRAEITRLARAIEAGEEEVIEELECTWQYDLNTFFAIRSTGETVISRELTPEERQAKLPLDGSTEEQNERTKQ